MLSRSDMVKLLMSVDPPEYIRHHRDRIVSCIADLQSSLTLQGLKTLDLGHDSFVGLLLVKSGCNIEGNVPPPELVGVKSPPEQSDKFIFQNGEVVQWTLKSFDFEKRFPYADSTFDLITAFEVIEHISDNPRAVLQEIKRVLKPYGYLYIGTPNICSFAKIIKLLRQANPYDSKPYSQNFGPRHFMCHVYEYSTWELKEFIKSEGFEIVNLRTWDPYTKDPKSIRAKMLKFLISLSLLILGYFKEAALMCRHRGHQIGLLSKKLE